MGLERVQKLRDCVDVLLQLLAKLGRQVAAGDALIIIEDFLIEFDESSRHIPGRIIRNIGVFQAVGKIVDGQTSFHVTPQPNRRTG